MFKFFAQSFFKDRFVLRMSLLFLIFFVVCMVLILFNLEARNDKVTVRYSNYEVGLYDRETWTAQYVFPIFAVIVFISNTYIATKLHAMRKEYSYVWLGLGLVTMLFTIFITQALLGFSLS